MKKTLRRIVSSLISLLMCLAVISFPAYSADIEPTFIYVENTVNENGVIDYRYVDEEGNEVKIEENKLHTQSVSLPSKYNAAEKGYVTPIKDQGDSGVCWSFSAMSMLESDSIIKGYKTKENADFSEAHHVWFTTNGRAESENDLAYGDGYIIEDPFNRGGNWRISAASLSRWSGAANESEYPFYPYNLSGMGNYSEEDRYDTSGGILLESAVELSTMESIKQWIVEHGSVTAAFCYGNSYYNSSTAAYYSPAAGTVNHQITIVGWDDTFSASKFRSTNSLPSGNGAWLCKNSWSTYWGDDGYFWISYYDATIKLFAGYSVMESEDYYKKYSYNGAEWYGAFQVSNSFQVANVFEAEGYESLSAVALQTFGADIEVEIVIYKNINTAYNSPVKGTKALTTKAVLPNTGYHTVHLTSPVSLTPGETFSVVVRYYAGADGVAVVPVESSVTDGLTYASRTGESYLNRSTTGNTWVTSQSQGAHNFYIQALTKCNHRLSTDFQEETCTENGFEKIFCTQCEKVQADRVLNATGHLYGEWSEYTYSLAEGREISKCTCENCGDTMRRGSYTSNVVTLDVFLELLFARLKIAIRSLFEI